MNIDYRIQELRKQKGISQSHLADEINVSRQAVSKWESGQSIPDIDKIVLICEYFNCTTDYFIMGIKPNDNSNNTNRELISKILFITSTSLIVIGLLATFGNWYDTKLVSDIYGGMIIQSLGVATYYISKLVSNERLSLKVMWLNTIICAFMPISVLTGEIFHYGAKPYPSHYYPIHMILFLVFYFIFSILSYKYIKKIIK